MNGGMINLKSAQQIRDEIQDAERWILSHSEEELRNIPPIHPLTASYLVVEILRSVLDDYNYDGGGRSYVDRILSWVLGGDKK
jgi:hypothetical protein